MLSAYFHTFRNYGPDFYSICGIMTLKSTRIYGIMGTKFSGKMARPRQMLGRDTLRGMIQNNFQKHTSIANLNIDTSLVDIGALRVKKLIFKDKSASLGDRSHVSCILSNTSVVPSSRFVYFIHCASRICLGQSVKALVLRCRQICPSRLISSLSTHRYQQTRYLCSS